MTNDDPVRLSDFRQARSDASSVSRTEAARQFKFAFALVIILMLGTSAAVAVLQVDGWDKGFGYNPRFVSQTASD